MAEKNTHSILETIKKKMLKIDQKSEQPVKVSEGNEEFQYISSSAPKVAAAPVETKAPAPVAPKFEDNLGLDLEAKPAPAKPAEKTGGMGSFDDFSLDDLDLDEEEKTFATPAKPNPPVVAKAAPQQVEEELDEEDLEEFEDDVDFEEEEELEEEEEEELEEAVAAEVPARENPKVAEDVGPVDWLGNPIISSIETDELNLDVDAEIEEKLEAPKVEEVKHEEELDLEEPEEELENDEENLDLEEREEELEGDDEEELDEHEEELETEEEHEEDLEEEPAEDDLDNWEDEEEEEEVVQKQTATQVSSKMPSEDDLDFSDLEQEDDFLETPEVEKESPSFENLAKPVEVQKTQQPVTFEVMEAVAEKTEPVAEKHEIDLEFEKELMGFRADASETISAPKVPPINQPMSEMPVQNNVSVMNQQTNEMKPAEASSYDSTVRQVGDSVKKLLDAKNVVAGISSFSQSPALAELALHLMEPKIEKWFNDNLPELVEKIVREEIKKMIPKE
ncbi:MAG: DUF2497 domain-containing protein [Rickettsiales bacterium]|nr:DUF2497 domain-containing protein [Rickettsiales bacterium]